MITVAWREEEGSWYRRKVDTSTVDYFRLTMSDDEFASLAEFVVKETGILIRPSKRELLMNRLRGILRAGGFSSYGDYYRWLRTRAEPSKVMELIESITTTKTEFYRNKPQLEWFTQYVTTSIRDTLIRDRQRRFLIWSAGCSTGEEPYSLALILLDTIPGLDASRVHIIASDINPSALYRAREGRFAREGIRSVPPHLVERYLRTDGDEVVMGPRIRQLVTFYPVNLIKRSTWPDAVFDVIFCRNVLIYITDPHRSKIIDDFHQYLTDDGFLFLGHSETLHGVTMPYEYVAPSIYRKDTA